MVLALFRTQRDRSGRLHHVLPLPCNRSLCRSINHFVSNRLCYAELRTEGENKDRIQGDNGAGGYFGYFVAFLDYYGGRCIWV